MNPQGALWAPADGPLETPFLPTRRTGTSAPGLWGEPGLQQEDSGEILTGAGPAPQARPVSSAEDAEVALT